MSDPAEGDRPLRLLYIEDDSLERLAAERYFNNEVSDMSLTAVATIASAREELERQEFDAIITDYMLRSESGFDALDLDVNIPKIFLTGRGDERIAVQALKSGAYEYLVKDTDSGHLRVLPIVAENAVRRQRAEEALRLVRFENSVAGVVRFGERGGSLEANDRFARMIGYADAEALLTAYEKSDEHVLGQLEILKKSGDPGALLDNEQVGLASTEGDEVLALVSAGTYWSEAGEERIFEASVVDISALRRAERERERLREQLQQSQKMDALGTMASGMAHDFNNLLTVILGHADLAKLVLPTDHTACENLENISTACQRAQELVRHIVTFSRQSGSTRKNLHLRQVVEDALQLLQSTLPSDIELVTRFEGGDDLILGDRGQIEQVVINLCQNALHAMGDGEGRLELRLDCSHVDPERYPDIKTRRCVVLSVQDTGCGVHEDLVRRIFDPFFTTKPEGEGSGLGLSVVSGIVRHHEGAIDVDSKVGRGTTMTVLLPLAEGEAENDRPGSTALPGGRQRLLLVEDEDAVRNLIARMLTTLGYDVVADASGKDALVSLAHGEFDLLITDLRMPNMDGLELVSAARQRGIDVPVVVLSGTREDALLDRARNVGVDRFVAKPVTLSALAGEIRGVLDERELTVERSREEA